MSDGQAPSARSAEGNKTGRRLRPRQIALGMVLGSAVGLVIGAVLLVLSAGNSVPALTASELDAAVRRWEKRGPANYNLDLVLSGNQSGNIHLEVRGGEVVSMTRNGIIPSQRRTWDFWTVPNQFQMIREELEAAEDPKTVFGVNSPSEVLLRARFDSELGYPRQYQRVVLGKEQAIRWEITRFESIP